MRGKHLRRLICLAFIIDAAVLIGFYGGVAAYTLFWAALALPAISLVHALAIRLSFRVKFETQVKTAVRDEVVAARLVLINSGLFPLTNIRVRLTEGRLAFVNTDREFTCSLAPGEARSFPLEAAALHVGEAVFGAGEVRAADAFGLWEVVKRDLEPVTVLPRKRRAESLILSARQESERRRPVRSYFGDRSPDGRLRLYSPGDDVRYINWKASQLAARPILRNLAPEPRDELVIVPDSRRGLPDTPAGWLAADAVTEGTLIAADFFLRHGIPVRVAADSGRSLSVDTPADTAKLYELLSRNFFTGRERPDRLMEADAGDTQSGRRYIVLTWEPDAAFIERAKRLINNGAEITLIYIGDDARFRDAASSERRLGFRQVSSREDILTVLSGGGGS